MGRAFGFPGDLSERKKGESSTQWRRRQLAMNRRFAINLSIWPYREKCDFCHHPGGMDSLVGILSLETREGKIDAHVCRRCAVRLTNGVDHLIGHYDARRRKGIAR